MVLGRAGEGFGRDGGEQWWKTAVVYQIWPRSFADGDGDGIGDLAGIIARLDYLATLGVDVVWLSPIYPSPQDDAGYDISDYQDIDPTFGSLEQFDALLRAAHERGMRLVLATPPDVALIDIGLPGMSGYEVARAVRERLPLRRVRLIAVTGYGQSSDRERALAAGFDTHLLKPVPPEELERALHG